MLVLHPALLCSSEHIYRIAELLSEQWGKSVSTHRAMILRKTASWILIDSDRPEQAIGHIRLTPAVATNGNAEYAAASGLITSVIVDPQLRGSGFGSKMMDLIEMEALKQGYYALTLWTHDAEHFYARLGYARCVQRRSVTAMESAFESLNHSALRNLESVLAQRLDKITTGTDEHCHTTTSRAAVGAGKVDQAVWMRKQLCDEVPLQHLPADEVLSMVRTVLARDHSCSSGWTLHIQLCRSESVAGKGSLGLPWSQQVGPSCGLQALRFAQYLLRQEKHAVHTFTAQDDGACNGDAVDATGVIVSPNNNSLDGNSGKTGRSLLSQARELGYTKEGEMFSIHQLQDLAQRCLNNGPGRGSGETADAGVCVGGGRVQASVSSVTSMSCAECVHILTGAGGDGGEPGLVVFPYDRDDAKSTPCKKAGAAAHYALLCGVVILPAPGVEHTGDPEELRDIDPERVLLVGLHGMSRQPVLAPYRQWSESNLQLYCALRMARQKAEQQPRQVSGKGDGEGEHHKEGGGCVGGGVSLLGNCVVLRRTIS